MPQLNKDHDYGGVKDSQLRALQHVGLVSFFQRGESKQSEKLLAEPPTDVKLSAPYDSAGESGRAGPFLSARQLCSIAISSARGARPISTCAITTSLAETKTVEVRPVQGTFEIPGAHIITPGDPFRSILYYRLAKTGPGHMPHIGSEMVDERGLRLMHDWIRQLPHPRKDETSACSTRLRAL